ncbi:MAG TPA: DUF3829 domain-containing protein [Ignavibacteria bacterium]|nr:DUF3829 domain-containing protein [Ignavibacteria bacterium]
MVKFKFAGILILSIFILTGCSMFTKLKEKLSAAKEETTEKESVKESVKNESSKENMNFYNKYMEVMNKIQDSGEGVYKSYMSEIPKPGSVTKNSLIIPISFQMASQTLGNTAKQYERSLLDGGELSKLNASDDMKNDLENDLKNLLPAMKEFSEVSGKVSEYYVNREYKDDMSKVIPYEEEMKKSYEKYKAAFNKLSEDLKKYKPKRVIHDPESASSPDEKSSLIMLNAYGDILETAEIFFDSFVNLTFFSDMSEAKVKFSEFEKAFEKSRASVLSAEFSEQYKFMKYNFEDYFAPTAEKFISEGNKFFGSGGGIKSDKEFLKGYNEMINSYNSMIKSYNTNIGTINRVRSW